ncbi:MAG: hypothetical protein WA865_03575, partial [Spirulinaceae cyanobacterium]
LFNGNWDVSEIEISDSPIGLIKLGKFFSNPNETSSLQAEKKQCEFYPENLESLSVRLCQSKNNESWETTDSIKIITDSTKIIITNKNLVLEGSKSGFDCLGKFLVNYFSQNNFEGKHFHLDYLEKDPLHKPRKCSLVFSCIV